MNRFSASSRTPVAAIILGGTMLWAGVLVAADPFAIVSPLRGGELRLREGDVSVSIAPRIAESSLPQMPFLRAGPPASAVGLAAAQSAVFSNPEAWRGWAALAGARYTGGSYEAALKASRQMRAAAVSRREPLPLAADELLEKCERAVDAISLLD